MFTFKNLILINVVPAVEYRGSACVLDDKYRALYIPICILAIYTFFSCKIKMYIWLIYKCTMY